MQILSWHLIFLLLRQIPFFFILLLQPARQCKVYHLHLPLDPAFCEAKVGLSECARHVGKTGNALCFRDARMA